MGVFTVRDPELDGVATPEEPEEPVVGPRSSVTNIQYEVPIGFGQSDVMPIFEFRELQLGKWRTKVVAVP